MGISIEVVLALVCAVTFFRAGRIESVGAQYDYSYWWALMSIALSALVLIVIKAAWLALLLCQIGLFLGIGVYRAIRDPT
ncbi:hypothetical protein [Lysobacter sp. Root983]|uniref:hypothetical protein n=1 Tax=Lysobacter sp. Root983 TaxID=1736613 RepID=UPI0006FF02BA|nr:hypothetical protein [Lysobacter sp. Root983]KRA16171.1 hypothetical protein ASD69_15675 [Lysobacter sp. Root604]KRD31872.1 hypothetical protein ASE35_12905 [Lysobacter sp. Root916]KRD75741.1 hypothetical protein ASE43_12905 [Lysobacter sp. Root983]